MSIETKILGDRAPSGAAYAGHDEGWPVTCRHGVPGTCRSWTDLQRLRVRDSINMPVRPDLNDPAELFPYKSPSNAARIKLKTGEQRVDLRVEERERAVNRSLRTRNPEAPIL